MKKIAVLFVALLAITAACNKEAGEGGTSSISGDVLVNDIDGAGVLQSQYVGMDEDVYIIYGTEDQTYDDKFSTSLDGTFKFSHLTPGDYTVFAYSRCDTCASGTDVVQKTINIADKKTDYSVGTIEIFK